MTTFPTPLKRKSSPARFIDCSGGTIAFTAILLLTGSPTHSSHTVLSWPWWTDNKHIGQSCTEKYRSADRGRGQIQSKHVYRGCKCKHRHASAELWYQLSRIEGNEITSFDSHKDPIPSIDSRFPKLQCLLTLCYYIINILGERNCKHINWPLSVRLMPIAFGAW